jgi:hypothetical protein
VILPYGSYKTWHVHFDDEVDATKLYDRHIKVDGNRTKQHDPNEFIDKRTAIMRIHWLPGELSNEDATKFLVKSRDFTNLKILSCSEETYKNDKMTMVKNSIRRIKIQIPSEQYVNLYGLIGKRLIADYKSLVTIKSIKQV